MKKILILILLIGISQVGNTQFLEELKKEISESAKKAIKRKAKKETEKKVEKAMDSVLNPTLPKRKNDENSEDVQTSENETPDFMGLLKSGKCDSIYNYELIMTMRIVTAKKKTSDTTYMKMAHNETSSLVKMTSQNMLVITDWKNESSVMLNTSNKSYSVMSLKAMSGIINTKKGKEELESANNLKFTKTGKTKVICKKTCYQYIAVDGDMRYEMWGTDEIDFDSKKHKEAITKLTNQNFQNTAEDGGYLMEVITYKKDKLESHMLVTNVNTIYPLEIDLNNYKKN